MASEDPALAILDELPAMVSYWDRELRNVLANAAYREWFGLTPEQMRGMHAREVIGAELYEANLPELRAVLAGERQDFERSVHDASGRLRHTQVCYVPDDADAGHVRGFSVLVTDITAHVEAEARVRRSAELYRALVRSIPGGFVLLFDEHMRFQVADGEALPAFGYAAAALEGRTLEQAFPPQLARELEPRYRGALAGRSTTWDRVRGDRIYSLTAGPVRDRRGEVFAGTVICLDVTAERRGAAMERALHAIATLIAAKASVEEVAALVAESLHDVFALDHAAVVRFDAPTRASTLAIFPPNPALESGVELLPGDGSARAAVALTGRPTVVDYEAAGRGTAAKLYAAGLRTGAAAPVAVGGELWGAVAVASASRGAVDASLLARLANFAELVEVAIGNAQAWAELRRRATHDGVTGLPNHRSFHEHLARELAKAQRHGRRLGVVVLDIDFFKRINDRFGHPSGDRALAEVARRLAASSRREELAARVGGEEFALLLPDADGDAAMAVAERVRRAIAAEPFPGIGEITVSVGACTLEEAPDPLQLVACADRALYEAKRRGRNRSVAYAEVADAPATLAGG